MQNNESNVNHNHSHIQGNDDHLKSFFRSDLYKWVFSGNLMEKSLRDETDFIVLACIIIGLIISILVIVRRSKRSNVYSIYESKNPRQFAELISV